MYEQVLKKGILCYILHHHNTLKSIFYASSLLLLIVKYISIHVVIPNDEHVTPLKIYVNFIPILDRQHVVVPFKKYILLYYIYLSNQHSIERCFKWNKGVRDRGEEMKMKKKKKKLQNIISIWDHVMIPINISFYVKCIMLWGFWVFLLILIWEVFNGDVMKVWFLWF